MTTPSLPPTPPAEPTGAPVYAAPAESYQQPVIQPVKAATPKRSNAGGLLLGVAAVIAVGGIAFAVGRLTAPANASTAVGAAALGNAANGGFGAGRSFDPNGNGGAFARRALTTEATVTAVGPDSLTIQIGTGGQTIEVKTDASTTYHTQQPATANAITAGSKVLLQFNPPTTAAAPNASGAPAPGGSFTPGQGFFRNFGTVKDVTVLAAQ